VDEIVKVTAALGTPTRVDHHTHTHARTHAHTNQDWNPVGQIAFELKYSNRAVNCISIAELCNIPIFDNAKVSKKPQYYLIIEPQYQTIMPKYCKCHLNHSGQYKVV